MKYLIRNLSSPKRFFNSLVVLVGLITLFALVFTSYLKPKDIQKAGAASASWLDKEVVSGSANFNLPSTPLVANVNETYSGKEISFLNSDGEVVIYQASGGNPILTTSSVAGTITASNLNSDLAPTAINLTNDSTYEILVPGRSGTTETGTLKALTGTGSQVAGLNASFSQGVPNSAAIVDDWDADGNPEIFLTVVNSTTSTTSLLGWKWTISSQTLTGLRSGDPVLLTVTGSGVFKPQMRPPSIGKITSTTSAKEIVASIETSEGLMRIYVIKKNGSSISYVTSGTPEPPPNPSGSFWIEQRIDEQDLLGTTNPHIGGIALADFNADGKEDIVVVTSKQESGNPAGDYSVRSFTHSSATGTGTALATRLSRINYNGVYGNAGRPSVGQFQGQSKAVIFKTQGLAGSTNSQGLGLFAAYYSGGQFSWISNYNPRTITEKASNPCNVRGERSMSSVTLANGNTTGGNEAFYSKEYSPPQSVYTVYVYAAEGNPTDDTSCNGALDHLDVPPLLGYQNDPISNYIYSTANIELADADENGTIEAISTHSYVQSSVSYNITTLYALNGVATSTQDWMMTAGNECRQGRYRGSCPIPTQSTSALCTFEKSWIAGGNQQDPDIRVNDLALDNQGNLYAGIYYGTSGKVEKYSSEGALLSSWPIKDNSGSYQGNEGLTVDGSGNVYITHRQGVWKFSPTGQFLKAIGTNGSGDGQFRYPRGIADDSGNNIYVAEAGRKVDSSDPLYNTNRVQKLDSSGKWLLKWGTYGTGNSQFKHPYGVAVDSSNNVYVTDSTNNNVQVFTSSGGFLRRFATNVGSDTQARQTQFIALDTLNSIYISDLVRSEIRKYSNLGDYLGKFGSVGSGNGQFSSVSGMALNKSTSKLFVADLTDRIQRFNCLTSISLKKLSQNYF